MKKVLACALALTLLSLGFTDKTTEKWIEETLSKLTLEEKIDMIHAQSKFSAKGAPAHGIPELWCDDGPHGVRPETFWDKWTSAGWTNDSCTAYPALTCLAATWNTEMAGIYGRSVGEEARYRRKSVLLAPGVNILRTPLNGRNFEYFGEDPFLASKMCVPYIKGIQSNGVGACVKHYALNNQEHKRHKVDVYIDDRALYEIYLPAFEAAVKEGKVWSVMGAYNLYNGDWCCQNHRLMTEILKEEWGFDGVVMTDWGALNETNKSATSGLDMEFGSHTNGLDQSVANAYDFYYLAKSYLNKIRNGELPESGLDEKVRRVLRLHKRTDMNTEAGFGRFTCPDHFAAARRIGAEGIVLLENSGILPIDPTTKAGILVVGENAIKPMTIGGGSSSLKAHHEISPLDGIKAAYPNAEIKYERGYVGDSKTSYNGYSSNVNLTEDRSARQLLADAVQAAGKADIVIFIGGLNKTKGQDAEGADRKEYGLPYGQDKLIEALSEANRNLIVVNISGTAVAMPWAEKCAALIQDWYLGSEAGNSLADILTGAVCPSGKLPFTIPVALEDGPLKTEVQYPGILDEKTGILHEEYSEGIYVGYRWYEKQKITPRYPFGYGKSYTSFEYGHAKVSRKGKGFEISVPVRNTGKVAGAEVVELYISDLECSVDRPEKELKGFSKVYLEPGQTSVVKIAIDTRALSFFDAGKHEWVAEKGEFKALVGASSADIRSEVSFKL